MKTYKFSAWLLAAVCGMAVSCSDSWDEHFNAHEISSAEIEIYHGDVASYLKQQASLSEMKQLFESTGVLSTLSAEGTYTLIVCDNNHLDRSLISNDTAFVKNSISDISVSPDKLTQDFGIETRYETLYDKKNLRVAIRDNEIYINDDYKLVDKVKADNGYIYYVDGTIVTRRSIYEYLQALGDDYSIFKELVAKYEEHYFDSEKSTPDGFDDMGNTHYSDSVISVRNTLMDRYTENGLPAWNMRSENYTCTMFVPSNALITKALDDAYGNIPVWLNRAVTSADTAKFEKWIVEACFVDRTMHLEEVMPAAPDFTCVGGYIREVDHAQDIEKFNPIEAANWRPSVQTIDMALTDTVSNGVVYHLSNFKIPNHVVIYRVKARFYELWGAMSEAQQAKYFRWTNWVSPMICTDAQSSFTLTETLPTMYYHVLTAIPSPDAIHSATATDTLASIIDRIEVSSALRDSLIAAGESVPDSLSTLISDLLQRQGEEEAFIKQVKPADYICSVDYDGVLFNNETNTLAECNLPAGEYYLRMGFKHSLTYSLSIYFNDELLVENMSMAAQGSNFHFDRGGASSMEFFGETATGYPEGFDSRDWFEKDEKSVAYDTDGYQVAVITLPENGNFRIKVESTNMASLYDNTNGRSKNNVTQLMMYHWCLRPTSNNY